MAWMDGLLKGKCDRRGLSSFAYEITRHERFDNSNTCRALHTVLVMTRDYQSEKVPMQLHAWMAPQSSSLNETRGYKGHTQST